MYTFTNVQSIDVYTSTNVQSIDVYTSTNVVTKIEFIPLQLGKNQLYPASAMALLECIDQTLNSGIQLLDLGVSLYILINW